MNMKTTTIAGHVVNIEDSYNPKNDSGEYMSVKQRAYFKILLEDWISETEKEISQVLGIISSIEMDRHSVDEADVSDIESSTFNVLRREDRLRKLLNRIRESILEIETGVYGYCHKTGEEIGIGRLLARPITKYSREAQEELERNEVSMEHAKVNEEYDYSDEDE